MNCVFAILFLAGKNALMTDRLVILHNDENPFYGVYKPHSKTPFPSPSPQHKLVISNSKITGPGTYNSLYCSPTLEAPMIKDIISQGLTMLTDKELLPLDKAHMKLDICRQQIINLSQRPTLQPPGTLNELLQWKKCSVSHVITLAHEGKIFVKKYSNFDAPRPARKTFSINVDKEVEVSSIVSSDDFFHMKIGSKDYIIAWSQGHLHVFKRGRYVRRWIQITRFGAGKNNVPKLAKFLVTLNDYQSIKMKNKDSNSEVKEMESFIVNMASREYKENPFALVMKMSSLVNGKIPSLPIDKESDITLSLNKNARALVMAENPFHA